jgi:hypothetical protein
MGRTHIVAGGVLVALAISGCALFEDRTTCRWGAAGAGALAFGLGGAFGMNALDLSGSKSGGAIVGGAVVGAGIGAVIGLVVGNYACPEPLPPPPPEPGAPAPAPPAEEKPAVPGAEPIPPIE